MGSVPAEGAEPADHKAALSMDEKRHRIRELFIKAFRKPSSVEFSSTAHSPHVENVGYQTERLPWTKLPEILTAGGFYLDNWPAPVPFPCEVKKEGRSSQGLKDLPKRFTNMLLDSFSSPSTRIKCVKVNELGMYPFWCLALLAHISIS